MNPKHLIETARGDRPADLLLVNCRIVNVFSGEIISGNIAITDGHIAGVGNYMAAEKQVDMQGRFVAPGFIDSHVHIESSMASVTEFVRAVLPCGTTTVVADPHEIANVLGTEGIRYMLDSAEGQPLNVRYSLPSCVPATDMETSGAVLGASELSAFMNHERIPALAEMMNYPGVIYADSGVLAKIALAQTYGKRVDGHAPGLTGNQLNAYVAAGISSDHECTTVQEAMEKISAGMFIMVREGTCARNLDDLFPAINGQTWNRMMWCTDDRHAHDLMDQGHVDYIVRRAVNLGLDPVRAIQMGTLVPARYFGLRDAGAIAPGRRADMIVFRDMKNIRVEQTWCGGILVAENGIMRPEIKRPEPVSVRPAMNLLPDAVDFSIPAAGSKIRVIEAIPDQVVTRMRIEVTRVVDGLAVADLERDLLKIAVVERYTGKAGMTAAFVSGMGLKRGAIASSVAHDSHNIIVTGADDRDMKAALGEVVRMGGGFAVACDGEVRARLPLPIAGLMSHEPVSVIRRQLDDVISAARELGTTLHDPFMTLGFLALPVIPDLKITDKGLVDVTQFRIVPLFMA